MKALRKGLEQLTSEELERFLAFPRERVITDGTIHQGDKL